MLVYLSEFQVVHLEFRQKDSAVLRSASINEGQLLRFLANVAHHRWCPLLGLVGREHLFEFGQIQLLVHLLIL